MGTPECYSEKMLKPKGVCMSAVATVATGNVGETKSNAVPTLLDDDNAASLRPRVSKSP